MFRGIFKRYFKETEKVHEISKNKEFKEKKENLVEQLDKENQVFIYNRTEQILNQPLSKIQKKIIKMKNKKINVLAYYFHLYLFNIQLDLYHINIIRQFLLFFR